MTQDMETGLAQRAENAGIIQIQGIPSAAAEIRFGVGQPDVGRNMRHGRVHIIFKKEIAHIQNGFEPGGIDLLNNGAHVGGKGG